MKKKVSAKSLANLRPVKKGDPPLNPLGAGAHNPELKAVKKLGKKELAEIGNLVLTNNMAALQAVAKDPNATVLKMMMAALAVRVIQKGDKQAWDALIDRIVGPVERKVEFDGEMRGMGGPQVIVTLPSNGREVRDDIVVEPIIPVIPDDTE